MTNTLALKDRQVPSLTHAPYLYARASNDYSHPHLTEQYSHYPPGAKRAVQSKASRYDHTYATFQKQTSLPNVKKNNNTGSKKLHNTYLKHVVCFFI